MSTVYVNSLFIYAKYFFFSAERDSFTTEFYANPVAIGDFQKHCAQRRKYPVLLQIEFNNATKERADQVCTLSLLLRTQ